MSSPRLLARAGTAMLLALGTLAGSTGPAQAAPPFTACSNVLATGTYRLTQNLTCSSDPYAFYTSSPNVTLRLQGHTVDCAGGSGVVADQTLNFRLIGPGTLTNCSFAVDLQGTDSSVVQGITITAGNTGISLGGVNSNTADRNTVSGNVVTGAHLGISLERANSNSVVSNKTNSNSFGLYLDTVANNTIQANTMNNNTTGGVQILAGLGNRFTGNAASGNGSFSANDTSGNCTDNTWSGNHFAPPVTPACIR